MTRHRHGGASLARRLPASEPADLPRAGPAAEAPGAGGRGLEALYRRHAAWLRAALLRRFGRETAEDLSQEAFLRMQAGMGEQAARHPRGLLLTIAVNAARERLRRDRVRAPEAAAARAAMPEVCVGSDQDELVLLKQVVLALPPKLREVFLLSRFEGLTYEEIARRCGISVKTVEWRMTRALAVCSDQLKD
jgi:RNA polymerase sigma-70 factor (ECF subfamily)